MTKQELIHKLTDLEWEDFEVKEAKGEVPKSAWETVSAFSNSAGGWLVFGVKQVAQNFEVVEISNPEKVEQDFLAILRSAQKFNVQINPTCSKYVIDEKVVLAFYIPVSKNKPVYFNSQANTYIRRGSPECFRDQKASKEEIDSLYRDQTFGTKTSEIAAGTSFSDLRDKSIREYRDYMSRFNSDVSYNRIELNDFLVKMRILDKETRQCTYAGLLFFGNRDSIETFFPDFRVDLFEIPGTSNQDASSRYTFRLSEDDYENLWEVYFECFKRLRKEVDVEFKLTAEGFGEELSPGLKSVREALVNMLMHADYFSPAHPRVRIFSNHIEYYNPGGLPKPLAELKGKDLSIPRNPILAKLFRMVKLAENAGYGLDKIEHNWKEYNGTSVDYVIDFDSTIVKLRTKIDEVPINYPPTTPQVPLKYPLSSEEIIKLLLIIKGEMGRSEIQEIIGLKDVKHFRENYLEPALAAGLIRMKYPDSPNHPKQKYLLTEEGLLLKTGMK
jgi:predicted HTH transcriptional regulator